MTLLTLLTRKPRNTESLYFKNEKCGEHSVRLRKRRDDVVKRSDCFRKRIRPKSANDENIVQLK